MYHEHLVCIHTWEFEEEKLIKTCFLCEVNIFFNCTTRPCFQMAFLVCHEGDGIDALDDTSMQLDTQSEYVMKQIFSCRAITDLSFNRITFFLENCLFFHLHFLKDKSVMAL